MSSDGSLHTCMPWDACCVLCVVVVIIHIEKSIYLVISACNVVCRLVRRAYVKWFTGTQIRM
jgi:hypothetical protein